MVLNGFQPFSIVPECVGLFGIGCNGLEWGALAETLPFSCLVKKLPDLPQLSDHFSNSPYHTTPSPILTLFHFLYVYYILLDR